MAGFANSETACGHDARTQGPLPASQADAGGRDWYYIEAYEWMWRDDGLGLRPGAELMIYAAIYSASAHGGGVFVATNKSVGEVLGYPRETVSRAMSSLTRRGLIWAVGEVRDERGQNPQRCYAVSQRAIDRVLENMVATCLERGIGAAQASQGTAVAKTSRDETSRVTRNHALGQSTQTAEPTLFDSPDVPRDETSRCGRDETSREGCDETSRVTKGHAPGQGTGPAEPRLFDNPGTRRDETSREGCDETSRVTKHHTPKQGTQPAETALFDNPLISTNHLSTLSADQAEGEEKDKGDEGDRPLTQVEEVAFESLLRASIRPVDAEYVDDNKAEFARLVRAGVPCDVILEAYGDYARYHRRQAVAGGEMRSMHLLNWLKQNPNKNIQYLLNAKDDEWAAGHRGAVRTPAAERGQRVPERQERVPNSMPKRKHTHQEPRLDRCIDRNTVVWYVVDERGGRLVQGSKGVMGREEARRLYEAMYEEETTGRR